MLFALQHLFASIKKRYGLKTVVELKTSQAMVEFPERTWNVVTDPSQLNGYDVLFIFRPYSRVLRIALQTSIPYILLSSVNKRELGSHVQRMLQVKGEYYATQEELEHQATDVGLTVIESGYYDSPPWIDHSPTVIVPTRKIGITLSMIKRLLFFERLGTKFTSHHPYVLAWKKP